MASKRNPRKKAPFKRRGRPPLEGKGAKRRSISYRVTEQQWLQWDAWRKATGRSISQEAELRHELTSSLFDVLFGRDPAVGRQPTIRDIAGLRTLWHALCRIVGDITGDTADDSWQRYTDDVIKELPAILQRSFLRWLEVDLAQHGSPTIHKSFSKVPGDPDEAEENMFRVRYCKHAFKLLQAKPALQAEFPTVWQIAGQVTARNALGDRYEEDSR